MTVAVATEGPRVRTHNEASPAAPTPRYDQARGTVTTEARRHHDEIAPEQLRQAPEPVCLNRGAPARRSACRERHRDANKLAPPLLPSPEDLGMVRQKRPRGAHGAEQAGPVLGRGECAHNLFPTAHRHKYQWRSCWHLNV